MKEDEKAEFINGEVVIHSPVKLKNSQTSMHLAFLLQAFVSSKNLGMVGHEKLIIQMTRNDYEPDVCFFRKEKADQFKPDQMLFPAPDFIAEIISKSTENTDRTIKYEDYASHGVTEYWIIDPEKEVIEQYILENEKYTLRQKSGDGSIKSTAINGFEIPVRAVFDPEINHQTIGRILE